MKFVVSDLDGTLLHSHDKMSSHTVDIIKKLTDRGINFAIATGRGRQGVLPFLKNFNISPYLICNNGANIYTPQGECIFEEVIPSHISLEIIKEIRKNGLFYTAFIDDYLYYDKGGVIKYFTSKELFKKVTLEDESCPNFNKIIVQDEDSEVVHKITKILKEKFSHLVEVMLSHDNCMDIAPKNCSKGKGIENLAKIFNISTDEFMAFGDGENDFEMLKTVGHPVIMENSQELLKKSFKTTTTSNIDDGVAKYIEKYFKL